MENYEVQRLSAENIEDLISLYKAANHQVIAKDFLRKKYDTKIFGVEFIGYIAYSSAGAPIAFYGVIPCFVQLEGRAILAAQSADTMTHPDFQRQGLFYHLATKTFELAKEQGIQFIFGFASTNSLPGTLKLDFQILPTSMQLLKIPSGILPWGRWLNKVRLLKSLYDVYLHRVLSSREFPPLMLFQGESSDGIRHDQIFIDYKTYSKKFFVEMNGSLLWLKFDGQLKVGFMKLGHDTSSSFLRRIKRLAIISGCTRIIFITHKGSALYNFLSPETASTEVLPICFKNLTHETFAFEKMKFEYGDIDIF